MLITLEVWQVICDLILNVCRLLALLHPNEPDGDLDWSVLVGSGNLALTRMSLMFLQRR